MIPPISVDETIFGDPKDQAHRRRLQNDLIMIEGIQFDIHSILEVVLVSQIYETGAEETQILNYTVIEMTEQKVDLYIDFN